MGGIVKTVVKIAATISTGGIGGALLQFALGQVISFAFSKVFAPKSERSSFTQQKTDIKRAFRSSAASRRIIYGEAMVSGPMIYVNSTGSTHNYLHIVIALATHEIESIGAVYLGDRLSTDAKIAGLVRVKKHLGTATQAADADLVADVPQWTNSHTLSGIAYVYVRIKWDQDVWVNGIPNIKVLVKGKKLYDPRTSLTAWSDNWALCIRDYLTADYGLGATASEIDDAQLISAANICDELVPLAVGTQTRYNCNGAVVLEKAPADILDQLLTAAGGSIAYSQGVYKVFPAAYVIPTITLSEDDLRGEIKISPRLPKRDLFNAVRGVYVSPETAWEPTDFPPVLNSTYETQDGNQQIFRDIELSYTTDSIRAQRIAKIHLEKSRQGITVAFPAKLTALQITAMDVVMLNITAMGWVNKPFRVTNWKLSADGGVDLTLQEDSAASYNWALGEATIVDPAPDSNLPDPTLIDPPSAITMTSGTAELITGGDGSIISRIKVAWTAPQNVTVAHIELQYKLAADVTWSSSIMVNGDATTAWIGGVIDSQLYAIRLRSVSIIGVRSDWINTSHFTTGKAALPSDVTSFTVTRQADGTRDFAWQSVNDVDLAGYKIRYALGFGATWAGMTDLHNGLLVSSPWETNQLAAGDYTVGIKAIDTSGNESLNAVYINSTLGDPRIANAFAVESPHNTGWQGTITNGVMDADGLVAIGTAIWTDLTTWDAWANWSQSWSTTLIYEHTLIDIAAIISFRPLISVDSVGSKVIEINVSDDNITWSGWHSATSTESGRYIKTRVTVTNMAAPPQITAMTIILSGNAINEDVTDSNTATWAGSAAAGRTVPLQKSFAVITSIQLAMQSVGAGWTWEVVSKNNTAPIIRIYNNGTAADAVVDVTIKGFPT